MSARIRSALLVPLLALVAGGCAVRPIAVQEGRVYVGAFTVARQSHPAGSEYSRVEGVGLAAGKRGVGFGYFRNERVSIPEADVPHTFETPLAHVEVRPPAPRPPPSSP